MDRSSETGSGADAVLDASMDAVVTVDAEGRIRSWNASAAVMFGREAASVLGRELAETVVPPELRDAHRAGLARVAAGDPGRFGRRIETVGQRADGTRFPVELTICRVERDGRTVFVGFLRDITERARMLADLRESRMRLMRVSDDTRRRLERDLHDGAQQHLVALAISLSSVRARVTHDPDAAAAILDESLGRLRDAIDELRQLARGVHSGVLTERGLAAAVAHLARRSPLEVVVSLDVPGRLPPLVETSVYFLVAEALTNATKYGAHRVDVALALSGDVLEGTVRDDGPGGADPAKGTGLAGMSERLRALDGTVSVESPRGAGTVVRITVPLGARSGAPALAGA
ncbi:PAS domain S-box-containing protein [Motilibacter peucedani]|uniref:histidine kinase n=1 Tax=Motilibacter peucedani TaxID=598650 RepID=A0A420XTJ3_9ACTN|nr:PAS domain S-box protein [Motilibacter peucedani]RKS80153.1 PAS domain S-box-containing protein [Motilibacter peucedani]